MSTCYAITSYVTQPNLTFHTASKNKHFPTYCAHHSYSKFDCSVVCYSIIKHGIYRGVNDVSFSNDKYTSPHLYAVFLLEVSSKPAVLKKYESDFELLLPSNLGVEKNTPKSKEVAQKLKNFYFGDKPVSQDTLFQYVDVS